MQLGSAPIEVVALIVGVTVIVAGTLVWIDNMGSEVGVVFVIAVVEAGVVLVAMKRLYERV